MVQRLPKAESKGGLSLGPLIKSPSLQNQLNKQLLQHQIHRQLEADRQVERGRDASDHGQFHTGGASPWLTGDPRHFLPTTSARPSRNTSDMDAHQLLLNGQALLKATSGLNPNGGRRNINIIAQESQKRLAHPGFFSSNEVDNAVAEHMGAERSMFKTGLPRWQRWHFEDAQRPG